MRVGPFGEDDDEGDDEWSEAFDADVPRVDMVAQAASGRSFILMKGSAQPGLLAPSVVRDLIAKPIPRPERRPMARMHKYTRDGFVVTSARPLTNAQLATALRKAKATMVAVYDASGRFVGTVDESKITPLSSAAPAGAKTAPAKAMPAPKAAPAAPLDATHGPAASAAEAITKALQGVHWPTPRSFVKSAGTVDDRYQVLAKSLGKNEAGMLSDAVAVSAMRLQFSSGVPGPQAVRIAKSVALQVADMQARKPRPGTAAGSDAGLAAVRAVHSRPRTVR